MPSQVSHIKVSSPEICVGMSSHEQLALVEAQLILLRFRR